MTRRLQITNDTGRPHDTRVVDLLTGSDLSSSIRRVDLELDAGASGVQVDLLMTETSVDLIAYLREVELNGSQATLRLSKDKHNVVVIEDEKEFRIVVSRKDSSPYDLDERRFEHAVKRLRGQISSRPYHASAFVPPMVQYKAVCPKCKVAIDISAAGFLPDDFARAHVNHGIMLEQTITPGESK